MPPSPAQVRALRTRIFAGRVFTPDRLAETGLSWAEFNAIRDLAGLPPLSEPRDLADDKVAVGRPVTIERLAGSLLDVIGGPMVSVTGQVRRTPRGEPRTVSATSVNLWVSFVRMLARELDREADVLAMFDDHRRVVRFIATISRTDSSYSTRLHYLLSVIKYVPEFGRQVAGRAVEEYRARATAARDAERTAVLERTEDTEHAVRAWPEIAAALPRIAQHFGRHSLEHLACLLHVEVAGLRDDLKAMPWYREPADVPDPAPANYYTVSTGRILITAFKTAGFHPAYDVRLKPATRNLVRDSLLAKPRRHLLAKGTTSRLIARAFKAVDMPTVKSVNSIRHSRITHEMKRNPAPANLKRLASLFRHDPQTSMLYFRATVARKTRTGTPGPDATDVSPERSGEPPDRT